MKEFWGFIKTCLMLFGAGILVLRGCSAILFVDIPRYENVYSVAYSEKWEYGPDVYPNQYINDSFVVVRLLRNGNRYESGFENFELFLSLTSRQKEAKVEILDLKFISSLGRSIETPEKYNREINSIGEKGTDGNFHWYLPRNIHLQLAPRKNEKLTAIIKLSVTIGSKEEVKVLYHHFYPEVVSMFRIQV